MVFVRECEGRARERKREIFFDVINCGHEVDTHTYRVINVIIINYIRGGWKTFNISCFMRNYKRLIYTYG